MLTYYFTDYFWIGLNDKTTEGQFVWDNSGQTPTYLPPSYYSSNTENRDCVYMYYDSYDWYVYGCSLKTEYICEQALVSKMLEINALNLFKG
jgi:hypothetical protein